MYVQHFFLLFSANAKLLRASKRLKRETHQECKEPGFFGSATDCRHFYRCVEVDENRFIIRSYAAAMTPVMYKKFYYECSSGTIFDPMTYVLN